MTEKHFSLILHFEPGRTDARTHTRTEPGFIVPSLISLGGDKKANQRTIIFKLRGWAEKFIGKANNRAVSFKLYRGWFEKFIGRLLKKELYHSNVTWHVLKVLGKSVGLCKTTKRKDQLYISLLVENLYGEPSVKISTQTDSY